MTGQLGMWIRVGVSLVLCGHPALAGSRCDMSRLAERGLVALGPVKTLVEPLYERDPRRNFIRWGEYSPLMDRLDNYSSPATQQLIFSEGIRSGVRKDRAPESFRLAARPSGVYAGLGLELTPFERDFLNGLDSRFHVAVMLLNRAAQLGGNEPLLTSEAYASALLRYSKRGLEQLAEKDTRFRGLLEKLRAVDEDSIASDFVPADGSDLEAPFFNAAFLDAVGKETDFHSALDRVGEHLGRALDGLPTGVSYATGLRTMTVRFGDRHYSGTWMMFHSIGDKAMRKKAARWSPLVEVDFNVSRPKKKRLAINLDRVRGKLDGFFPEPESPCPFHVCGTFAPTLMMKSGIPVVSPLYGVPEPTLLSLAVQRLLGSPQIKQVRWKWGEKPVWGLPVTIGHLGLDGLIEVGFWTLVLGAAARGVMGYIENDENGRRCEVREEEGEVTVGACR